VVFFYTSDVSSESGVISSHDLRAINGFWTIITGVIFIVNYRKLLCILGYRLMSSDY
jgi:hypothetical protein